MTLSTKQKQIRRTSLVVQWIGIHRPMQGTWVWFLVQEESTCHGATRACTPQTLSLHAATTKARVLRAYAAQ